MALADSGGGETVIRAERRSAAGQSCHLKKDFWSKSAALPAAAAVMHPAASNRMAGFGEDRHSVERTATAAGPRSPPPDRRCWAPCGAASNSRPGQRDAVRTAGRASLIRQGPPPGPDLDAAELAARVGRRRDLHRCEGPAAATTEETSGGAPSNGRDLPTMAVLVSRLRCRNWVLVCKVF